MAKKKSKSESEDVLLLTKAGYEELVKELADRRAKQEVIAKEIDEARRLGDLSENEPYTAAMQKKEMNDSRISELEYMTSIAQVVESANTDLVGIGSTVEIERLDNKTKRTVILVGRQASQESNPREGKISIDSPLGEALNAAKAGDVVVAKLPIGDVQYKILKISA